MRVYFRKKRKLDLLRLLLKQDNYIKIQDNYIKNLTCFIVGFFVRPLDEEVVNGVL